MINANRTVYSAYLQTCLINKAAFQLAANSTLNEALGIEAGVPPAVTPSFGYVAIGNGGHTFTIGADNIPVPKVLQHRGTDAALYSHLPFVLRALNNDLDAQTAANYALRKIITVNAVQYIAYYLKRVPISNIAPDMELVTVDNAGNSTTAQFIPSSANLNPTPPSLNNAGVNVTSGSYVAASSKFNLVFTANDVAELMNVSTILYGDVDHAIISEIALCSGVDKVVQSPAINNTTINFNEAVAVQCLSFVNCLFAMTSNASGLNLLIDTGSSEPNFNLI